MPRAPLLSALLLVAGLPSTTHAAATLIVEVHESQRDGPLRAGVPLVAGGANPDQTKADGRVIFVFRDLKPGDPTTIGLQPCDWVIVNDLETQVTLPASPEAQPHRLVVSKPELRRDRAQAVIADSLSRRNEAELERKVKELEARNAASVEALAAARRERDANRGREEQVAKQLAAERAHSAEVVALYQAAVSASDEKYTGALATLSAQLEREEKSPDRASQRVATGTLSTRRWLPSVMPSATWLDGAARPGLWLGAETLAPGEGPLSRVSLNVELGGIHWKETASFTALPGTRPVSYDSFNSLVSASTGARYYVPLRGWARLWVGAAVGILAQPDYGWSEVGWALHGTAGVFVYPMTWRVGLELRVSELETRHRERVFDPFGGVRTDDRRRYRPALTAGVQVVPVMW